MNARGAIAKIEPTPFKLGDNLGCGGKILED